MRAKLPQPICARTWFRNSKCHRRILTVVFRVSTSRRVNHPGFVSVLGSHSAWAWITSTLSLDLRVRLIVNR
jgi:hypothetical protein